MRENPAIVLLIFTPLAISKTAMLDIDIPIAKKSIEKTKYSWLVNILKESVKAIIIKKYIFDLRLSLKIGKLLGFVSALEKQLIKTIFEDNAIQFCINILGSTEVLKAFTFYSWYSMKRQLKREML